MRFVVVVLTMLLGAVACRAAEGPHDELVQAQIFADVLVVQAGKPFTVGVLLTPKPGWHLYWINSGDSGLPTQIDFTLPESFTIGKLQYPVPVQFDQPGGVIGYGYGGPVMFTAVVTPPEKIESSNVSITATASWLCCESICVPGSAVLPISLPVGAEAAQANENLFETWRQRMPVSADAKVSPAASARVSGGIPAGSDAGRFEILLDWKQPPAEVRWYPVPESALAVNDIEVRTDGRATRISFTAKTLAGQKLSAHTLATLVSYRDAEGQLRGVNVDVPLHRQD